MSNDTLSVPQRKVLAALQQATRPLSAYEILDQLRKKGVRSPPTVYRALDKLVGLGFVHRVETMGAFVACCHAEEENCTPAALAICTSCGQVEELCGTTLDKTMRKLASSFLAQIDRQVIEIAGLCALCRKQEEKGGRACSA